MRGAAIPRSESVGGGNLLFGSRSVSLVGQEMRELGTHCEGRRIFRLRGRVEILLQPLDRRLRFTVRLNEIVSAIDQSWTVLLIERGSRVGCVHHVVDTPAPAVEGSQVHPRTSRAGRLGDGTLEIGFRCVVVLPGFRDARIKSESSNSVHGLELRDQSLGAAESTSDDGGRFDVILAKIGQSGIVAGIELHSLLKFRIQSPGQPVSGKQRSALSLLAVSAAQPEMVIAVAGLGPDRGRAVRNRLVPLHFLVVNPAAKVVRFGVRGILPEGLAELLECAVSATAIKIVANGIGGRQGRAPCQRGGKRKNSPVDEERSPQNSPYWTMVIGTPSLNGWPLVVVVATWSPAFTPLTICT